MLALDLDEARLLRLLSGFFGRDQVLVKLSVLALCGGQLPPLAWDLDISADSADLEAWARSSKCLFTVTDEAGDPRLVIEFSSGDFEPDNHAPIGRIVDLEDFSRQRHVRPVLNACNIHYVTLPREVFWEMLEHPEQLDICTFLSDKVIGAKP